MDFSEVRPEPAEYSVADSVEESNFRERPDGSLNPAGEAGWFLQRERERLGLTLEEVSEVTGIHPYHLEAIEYGDLTRMPNRADALNMVGYYAHYLGFDPEPLIHHYATILPKPVQQPKKGHPANPGPLSSALILKFGKFPKLPRFEFPAGAFPGGAGGAAACLLAAVIIFAGASWLMLSHGEGTAPRQTAQVEMPPLPPPPEVAPDANSASSDVRPAEQVAATTPDSTASTPPVPSAEQTEQLDGLAALIEQNVPEGETAAPAAKPAAVPDTTASIAPGETAAPPPAADGSRLTLRAKGPVWVRIEDANGNVVMTQMLMPGDTYQVPNREGLVVIARDGGLLAYLIDGKEKGILGPPGEILVGRPLDIKQLDQQG